MRHRAQKSITGPERRKERETFCVRFGKWTRFLRWRTQLHKTTRIVSRFSIYTALLDVLESRVMKRTSISYCAMRDFAISAMANSTTQNDSHCESFFYLYSLIRLSRITSDEKNINKLLSDARLRVRIIWEAKLHSAKF